MLAQFLISFKVAELFQPLEEPCKSFKVRKYKSPRFFFCQGHYGKMEVIKRNVYLTVARGISIELQNDHVCRHVV